VADEGWPRVTAPTEARNPRTVGIDQVPILALLHMLNAEDTLVPAAVAAVLPDLASVVDVAARRIEAGGRMHYFGAGTSGRIATMDAAEVIPTFGVPPGVIVAHHAGGTGAMRTPREALEDSEQLGAEEAAETGPSDVVVGLSASGRTPYVRGALRRAREQGAFTVLVSSDPQASLAAYADVHLAVATGPEAIAGSTRLKAATAQKLVLNSLSTAVMIQCGRTWSNLMVELEGRNEKLRARLVRILEDATGEPSQLCVTVLIEAEGDLKTALVALLTRSPVPAAAAALTASGRDVRAALSQLGQLRD
jgi:N-acetylmuramic acid 6-phosphate etherase